MDYNKFLPEDPTSDASGGLECFNFTFTLGAVQVVEGQRPSYVRTGSEPRLCFGDFPPAFFPAAEEGSVLAVI